MGEWVSAAIWIDTSTKRGKRRKEGRGYFYTVGIGEEGEGLGRSSGFAVPNIRIALSINELHQVLTNEHHAIYIIIDGGIEIPLEEERGEAHETLWNFLQLELQESR